MMAKTGLLILTNPIHIGKILPTIKKQVKNTLYIHLTNALNESHMNENYKPEIFTSLPKYSKTIRGIYSEAASHCGHLDVRVLISNLRQQQHKSHFLVNTSRSIDLVIFDKLHEKQLIDKFLNNCIGNKQANCSYLTLENNENCTSTSSCNETVETNCSEKIYKHVVLGGTFDRLHTGHKILLTEAVLHASEKITVGVTDANMLNSKILWELVEPIETRLENVRNFLTDVCTYLNYNIVPIQDPFGPTKNDPTMNMIVVSAETLRGGEKVNELREKNSLQKLDIISVDLIDCQDRLSEEEEKISSSTNRRRLLGTLLKTPKIDDTIDGPYVIGLTGGIASGKSAISQRLMKLGAAIIDCDKIGHELYQKGKPCHKLVHEAWGDKVLDENGEINRKVLGGIVFGDKNELQRLNSLVWPAIAQEVQNRIRDFYAEGQKVIVIEAAVLVTAGWEKLCNEVWACIIPADEAVKRLQNRNNLKEVEAKQRIGSQVQNTQHVQNAHVIFCTFWSFEYTQYIVEKAWALLQKRLPKTCKDNKL